MLKNLIIRALSGAVMAAILFGSIWYSSYTLTAIMLIIGLLSLWEYLGNMQRVQSKGACRIVPLLIGATLFMAVCGHHVEITLPAAILLLVVRFLAEIFRPEGGQLTTIPTEVMGIVYTVMPMSILAHIGDSWVITAIILTVWANDIGAYLVGITMGKHKMAEKISPKKSWEGFAGGLLFALLIGGGIMHHYLGIGAIVAAVVSILVAVAAVGGDLFESMLKRRIGIKDSGNIIPGHGGMLDRFDALFFAVPVYYAVTKIITCFI